MRRVLLLLLAGLLAPSCTTVGRAGRELHPGAELGDRWLQGEVVTLKRLRVLDARDFTYAVEISRPPAVFAWSHLGASRFELGVWELDPEPRAAGSGPLGEVRHDAEALAISADGRRIAVAARDGQVRVFARATAALERTILTEEPLTAVAWSPDGTHLVVGSDHGLLTVFEGPELRYASEVRGHRAEVRALAFDDAGRLYSGSWDKTLRTWTLGETGTNEDRARVRLERQAAFRMLTVPVNGSPLKLAVDGRAAQSVVTLAAAKRAGIEAASLGESTTVTTASGTSQVRLARAQTIAFKSLRGRIDVAICDACVPAGVEGVLGQDLQAVFDLAFDDTMGEALVTARAPSEPRRRATLVAAAEFAFDQHVQDLTVDRAGQRLGVAFDEVPAERTLEIYQREKKGIEEPFREGNFAAIVDARTGAILRRFATHRGIVATAAISPDGRALASGGWDKRLFVHDEGSAKPVFEDAFGWSVRRVRFSPDGRYLAAGAWTPQLPYPDRDSDPAAVVYDVRYGSAEVSRSPAH